MDSQFSGFLFLSLFLYVPYPSLGLSLLSQQYCIFCNFQPHLLRCIHDRLIHILHKCDCLLHFYFWIFCHNNFTWAQCALSRSIFSTNFSLQMFEYISHTPPYSFFMGVLAAVFYWSSSLSPMSHFSFKCFMSTCCNIYFSLICTLMAFYFFTFIAWKTFFHVV